MVTGELLASGLIELYFSYLENKDAMVAIQKEKAQAAALSIEGFVREIERQLGWVTQPQLASGAAAVEQRRFDFIRLQRQVLAITEVSLLDATGREQLAVLASGHGRGGQPRGFLQRPALQGGPCRDASTTGRSTSGRSPSRT